MKFAMIAAAWMLMAVQAWGQVLDRAPTLPRLTEVETDEAIRDLQPPLSGVGEFVRDELLLQHYLLCREIFTDEQRRQLMRVARASFEAFANKNDRMRASDFAAGARQAILESFLRLSLSASRSEMCANTESGIPDLLMRNLR